MMENDLGRSFFSKCLWHDEMATKTGVRFFHAYNEVVCILESIKLLSPTNSLCQGNQSFYLIRLPRVVLVFLFFIFGSSQ